MPRSCTVCEHEARDAIDHAIVGGAALVPLAQEYGVDRRALGRHRDSHLSASLVTLATAADVEQARSLRDRVLDLLTKAERILQQATDEGKVSTALSAVREVRGTLALLGQVTGELAASAGPQVVVNLAASPEWSAIRTAILVALAPYPEAKAAVVRALASAQDQATPVAIPAEVVGVVR